MVNLNNKINNKILIEYNVQFAELLRLYGLASDSKILNS